MEKRKISARDTSTVIIMGGNNDDDECAMVGLAASDNRRERLLVNHLAESVFHVNPLPVPAVPAMVKLLERLHAAFVPRLPSGKRTRKAGRQSRFRRSLKDIEDLLDDGN